MTTIKKLRQKHQISGRVFSERIGFNQSYISMVENGRDNISPKSLEKIAHEFDEPIDLLMIAHGYLPEYAIKAARKDAEKIEKAIRRTVKKIMAQKEED